MIVSSDHKLLIIETSGSIGQVALARGAEVCARRELDGARRHARDLAPALQELLREQSWRPADITAILVSRGPGSYTGLRVGIMSAKTFAYATGSILLGLETFTAIARQISSRAGSFLDVIADAQQEKVYRQRYALSEGRAPTAQGPLAILPLSQWLGELMPGVVVSGPGLREHGQRLPAHVQVVEQRLWDPQPESLLELGLERLAQGEHDDPFALEPLYLRASSAEEKWEQRLAEGK